MDTLRRVGSLRLSRRGRKKSQGDKLSPTATNTLKAPTVAAAKAYFTVSCKDVLVSTLNGYQPSHISAIVERRRKTRASEPVLWEPSLKCTSTGSAVWHPPFVVALSITVPKFAKKSSAQVLRHKDAYISIENVDVKKKGKKRKLLAKARLNLSEYFESAAEKDVSFRLKLHPESSKVSSASVDLTIRKSVRDPAQDSSEPCLDEEDAEEEETGSLLAPSHPTTPGSTPRGSCGDLDRLDNQDYDADDSLLVISSPVVKKPSGSKIVPNVVTPPPLPPRQKILSQDSPPTTPNGIKAEHLVTSTPLVMSKSQELTLPPSSPAKKPGTNLVGPTAKSSPNKLKEIDWNDEHEEEIEMEEHSIGINVPAVGSMMKCASSPKIMKSAEKDLIEWARASLASSKPQVKVTNLTSSWRNGLGFCAIIHQAAPSLIPLADLSSDNAAENNEIAFDAADLLGGVDTSAIRGCTTSTDKSVVSAFLNDLRARLAPAATSESAIDAEAVICFQKKWYVRGKYFRNEVGHLVIKEEKARTDPDDSIGTTLPSSPPPAKEEEDAASSGPSTVTSSPEAAKGLEELSSRDRVKRLIAAAHDSSSYDDNDDVNVGHNEDVIGGGRLTQSMTILEELSELAREEEAISAEIEKLEVSLRSQDKSEADESDFEAMLQRYVSLVNQKNSVVRRQMQLNLAEKERAIEHKKDRLQRQLQKFSDLDESQKTEAMRLEEEKLLSQYVEAVNARNELVHAQDSQEKQIAEDDRIKAMIANRDILAQSSSSHKHNIMDEFLDFFKKK